MAAGLGGQARVAAGRGGQGPGQGRSKAPGRGSKNPLVYGLCSCDCCFLVKTKTIIFFCIGNCSHFFWWGPPWSGWLPGGAAAAWAVLRPGVAGRRRSGRAAWAVVADVISL